MSNHNSTESAIKNLEIQVGQLAKQIAENSSGGFGANTERNPKEQCKVVMTRSKRETMVEDENRTSDEKELEAKGEKRNEEDLMRERKISEKEEEKNKKKLRKREKMRKKKIKKIRKKREN